MTIPGRGRLAGHRPARKAELRSEGASYGKGPRERKVAHRLPGERTPRIGHCRPDRRHARFADARRRLGRGDDHYIDARHLADAEHAVVVVVGLDHAAFVQRDLVEENRAQAEADAALHLRLHVVGVDGDAAVDRAPYALDLRQSVAPARNLGDLRDVAFERLMHGNAARTTLATLGALPAR